MKFRTYILLSTLALISLVYHAYSTRKQFYPTIQYLVSSKLCFVVVGNLLLAVAMSGARFVKTLFFGNLREVEAELIVEKAKYAVIETCLALTIFRSELTPSVVSLFASLIFLKLMHKLSKLRLEYLEQIAPVPTLMVVRMGFLLTALLITDVVGLYLSVHSIVKKGRSVIILFAFEFGLLLVYTTNLLLKFILTLLDVYLPNGLQTRGLLSMIIDVVCEAIKFATYIALFGMIFVYYGLPFHLIRDVWSAFHSFQRRLLSFIRYLQLTQNLDQRFPDASEEEIREAGTCLVCREELSQGSSCKKLRCGHIFHLHCLRMWLQHQQSCPLCR